ncbi:MAG: signal peptide peptidase SppA [Candidatus Margulisbacteria bacterium]|nr:signal peptide peptidase SppA [Candidatus Margulisiibacteriota bacterium]
MPKRFKWLIYILILHLSFDIFHLSFAAVIDDNALKRDIGARYTGMGGAGTAIADDGSAVFYNPSNLAQPGFSFTYGYPDTEQRQINGSNTLVKAAYLGYASWWTQDNAANRVNANALGFGNKSGWMNWGLNVKDLNWSINGTREAGWSSDLGFLARVTPQFKIGLLLQDLFTNNGAMEPTSSRLGFGYTTPKGQMVLAGDLEIKALNQMFGHLGVEANLSEGLAVRAGIDRSDPTAGASLDFGAFNLDYAAVFESAGQTIHKVDVGVRLLPQSGRPYSIIKPKEFALIDVTGALRGGRSEYSFLGGMHPGADSILLQIRRAAKDDGIDGIMLRIGGFDGGMGGMAMVQEMREELVLAKQKGKKVVAYLDGGALGDEYYLAAIADKIITPPGSGIGGLGKSVSIIRLEGLFEKFGIEWQIICQGKYKDAFHPYNDKMTADQKEMIENLIADLHRKLLTDIATDRHLSIEKVKAMGEGNIYTGKEAQQKGLIDEIGYFKDARKLAAKIAGEEKDEARMVTPQLVSPDETFLSNVFGVAVIEIDGEIVSGGGGENVIFGGRYVGSDTIVKYIHQASDDMFVKAIVLRINSPGGGAVAAGEIYEAMQYAREKEKIIIASIGNLGASGGYYIASAADKIVADPSSLVGAIGVIGYFPAYEKLLKKFNVKVDTIKEGKHADMFSGMRRLTKEEIADLTRMQKEAYREFIDAVVEGRGITTTEAEAAAEGQLFSGQKAKDMKLVDELGGFQDAIDLAKQQAKITGEPRLLFYHTPSMFFQFGDNKSEFNAFTDWLPRWLLPNWPGQAGCN